MLVGCDDDKVRLPKNQDEKIFDLSTISDKIKDEPVEYNWKQYYDTVGGASEMYAKTLNRILLNIAKISQLDDESTITVKNETVHDYKILNNPVYEVKVDDTHTLKDHLYTSVAFDYDQVKLDNASQSVDKNVDARSKKSMADVAKGGSYSKENLFIEKKYAQYLTETYNYIDSSIVNDADKNGKFILPTYEYDDIFSSTKSMQDAYAKYRNKETDDDIKINYLVAEYIYNRTYSSIGNSNARKVQIISLTDRSDDPGAAKKLLNAYIEDYIKGGKKDDGFKILARLWKGITKSAANSIVSQDIATDQTRYDDSIILTNEEETWLRTNGILPAAASDAASTLKSDSTSASTLTGKVLKDKKKIEDGIDNYYRADLSLESEYTGSGAYSYQKGLRKALDDIAAKNLVTQGIYLQKDGISGIPDELKDRIFSPRITTSKANIELMKTGVSKDITVIEPDGYRYLTFANAPSGSNDEIIYYDASSKTYYLTRLLDVVDTNALSKTSTTSIYSDPAQKEQIAREVAYCLSTTGNYKNDAIVYWLSRTKFKYYDEDFLTYIKDNYKDVFKKDNPYKNEQTIDITDVNIDE